MADLSTIFSGGFAAALNSTDLADPVESFRKHCEANGLDMSQGVNPDGEIHRVKHISSKKGALDGWYILHLDGKIPAGVMGCWKEPSFESGWKADIGRAMTFQENIAQTKWLAEVNAKKAKALDEKREIAAERAGSEVQSYAEASDQHPYLLRKQVKPHGIKIDRAGNLVIPVISQDGEIMTHQTIYSDGTKKFMNGGAKSEGFFEIRGNRKVVFVAEGFATGASIHEATGYTVMVAFDCGNIPKVAKVAKELFVGAKIIIGADNDQFTDGNPGLAKGRAAAALVFGEMVHPVFSDAEISAGKPTDFNDLHCLRGLDAVRDQIEMVVGPVKDKMAFEFSRVDSLELTEIQWIVDDYIESDSLAQVFGDPGGGKSFVAIDIACCIATGTKWHGHEVKQGAVFYIAGEGHNGLARRFRGWTLGNNITLDGAPLYKSHRAAQLYDATEAAIVAESIKQLAIEAGVNPSMVIIDTLARNMGGDENSTEDMNAFIQHLDLYLRQPYKCCVLVVHHSGAMDKDRSRGSTALRGALDAEYKCQLDQGSKTITFEAKKMKDAEMPESKAFSITQVDLPMLDKHGEAVKGAYLTSIDVSGFMQKVQNRRPLTANQSLCLKAITELQISCGPDQIVTDHQWRESSKTHGVDSKKVTETFERLVEKGMVIEASGGYRLPINSPVCPVCPEKDKKDED